jgi:Raf kinase inhibitor-like YbhB/YbcL family protein
MRPPLTITDVPDEAKSLVLIVEDRDTIYDPFTHWILFNINPHVGVILDNTIPSSALQGMNDAGTVGYVGPNHPAGTHRIFFHLYAIRETLPLKEGASRLEVEEAIKDQIIEEAELLGIANADIYYA